MVSSSCNCLHLTDVHCLVTSVHLVIKSRRDVKSVFAQLMQDAVSAPIFHDAVGAPTFSYRCHAAMIASSPEVVRCDERQALSSSQTKTLDMVCIVSNRRGTTCGYFCLGGWLMVVRRLFVRVLCLPRIEHSCILLMRSIPAHLSFFDRNAFGWRVALSVAAC